MIPPEDYNDDPAWIDYTEDIYEEDPNYETIRESPNTGTDSAYPNW